MKTTRPSVRSLLVLAALAAPGLAALHAQTVSPVPAPTIITTAPYTISAAGYYQLGANLSYNGTGATNDAIITVNASNVTLDFAGHFIAGPTANPGTALYGVYAYEHGNLTIQNGTAAYCYEAIHLDGNNTATSANYNQTVRNMLLTYNYCSGVNVTYTAGASIADNRITHTGGTTTGVNPHYAFGVYIYSGSGVTVSGNTITTLTASAGGNAFGIYGGLNYNALNNAVSGFQLTGGGTTYGIYDASFAVGNLVSDAYYGLFNCVKYQSTLTQNCTTPYSGGTAVGTNN